MSLYLGDKPIANDGLQRLTGEIGDIGIAPLGIDESLNLRRYLNGQIISQTQFEAFTNKVKSAIALYPNLAATEENWQAEVTASVLGQCGKFVVDDEAGTIRLPKVVNINGLQDLTLIGGIKAESLPNIKESVPSSIMGDFGSSSGTGSVFEKGSVTEYKYGGGSYGASSGFDFNVSRKYPTYQDDAPVQQEAIQYPYYIQVATGIEETLPAIREYKVNNSDYFGKSMYSDITPDNASYLASNGQYNARAIYPDYYDWLVEQMNKGVDKFKGTTAYQFKGNTPETEAYAPSFTTRNPIVGSVIYGNSPIQALGYATQVNTDGSVVVQDVVNNINATLVFNQELPNIDWFTDYDFVVNQDDQTFRLPLLNGEEDLPGTEITSSIFSAITTTFQTYTCPTNGFVFVTCSHNVGTLTVTCNGFGVSSNGSGNSDNRDSAYFFAKKGDVIAVQLNVGAQNSTISYFLKAVGNGTLYYYVGDVVQDASLINAGSALSQLSDKISRTAASDRELVVGWVMPDYDRSIDLASIFGANGTRTFTAPSNGFFYGKWHMANRTIDVTINNVKYSTGSAAANESNNTSIYTYLSKGDTIAASAYSTLDTVCSWHFAPCKGV